MTVTRERAGSSILVVVDVALVGDPAVEWCNQGTVGEGKKRQHRAGSQGTVLHIELAHRGKLSAIPGHRHKGTNDEALDDQGQQATLKCRADTAVPM